MRRDCIGVLRQEHNTVSFQATDGGEGGDQRVAA